MLRKTVFNNRFLSTSVDSSSVNMSTNSKQESVDAKPVSTSIAGDLATSEFSEQQKNLMSAIDECQQVEKLEQKNLSVGNNNSNSNNNQINGAERRDSQELQKEQQQQQQLRPPYVTKKGLLTRQKEFNCSSQSKDSNESKSSYARMSQGISEVIGDEKFSFQENDEWQLLEVEDDSSSEVVSSTSSSEADNDKNNNMSSYQKPSYNDSKHMRKEGDTAGAIKKYVDIDPLGPDKARNSPALIYLCTAIYALLPLAATITTFTLIALTFTRLFPIPLIYFAYIIWNRRACNIGGQRVDWFYRARFWSYLAAYFPIRLRHSTNFKLDPSKNYILNFSPHGIAAFGSVTAFGTNGLNFSDLFPGIRARFMVHETSFMIPIMREVFSFRGDCSVNSKSIDYMLTKQSTGNLLAIVVGGLAEADLSDSEILKVVVAERKGFVKKALVHGADIIPCIAFGENSVFKKVTLAPESFLHRLESRFYELFKFKHPIYYGTSIFSKKHKGIMPYRRPITVVMDDPIRVDKISEPSQEDIDKLHSNYIEKLKSMYYANNDLCTNYDKQLELV